MTTPAQNAQSDTLDPGQRVALVDERVERSLTRNAQAGEQMSALTSKERMAVALASMTLDDSLRLAATLFESGICPAHVKKPAQAFAIILAGRELGIGPMLSLRSLQLIKGKMTLAADLQLGLFKAAGGRAEFRELSATRAELHLRHPNGDTHAEVFTIDEAEAAGLLAEQPNYRRFPKAMLRSRCITNGLKSLGFEPTSGAYDPDEAQHFLGPIEGATFTGTQTGDSGSDEVDRRTSASATQTKREPVFPYAPFKGVTLTAMHPDGTIVQKRKKKGSDEMIDVDVGGQYVVPFKELQRCEEWAIGKLDAHKRGEEGKTIDDDGIERLNGILKEMRAEIERREIEAEKLAAQADNAESAARPTPAADSTTTPAAASAPTSSSAGGAPATAIDGKATPSTTPANPTATDKPKAADGLDIDDDLPF